MLDLDPEVALLLAQMVDEQLVTRTGADSDSRVGQAIARAAYALGHQHGVAMARAGHARTVVTVAEYAALTGVSGRTVRRKARAGLVPGAWRTSLEWMIEVD